MLAKKYKLPIQHFFEKQSFSAVKSRLFIFRIARNNLDYSRFGVIVSGKLFKTAVLRNKIKRNIFNFIRLRKIHLEKPGLDILISVLPNFAELSKEEAEKTFLKELIKEIDGKPR